MLDLLLGPPGRRAAVDYTDRSNTYVNAPYEGRGRNTRSGVRVTEELSLTYSAVWCAVRAICETAAMLPLKAYRTDEAGDRREADELPAYDLVKGQPNPTMGSMAFREGRFLHQVLYGGGFAEIVRGRGQFGRQGPVEELWPIHPSRVHAVSVYDDAEGFDYAVTNPDGSRVFMRADELLHFPGVHCEDGLWGKGVIQYARESVGFGLATERHGAAYFGGGGQPRGVVSGPSFKNPEARKQFRADWKEIHGSPDSAEIAIIQTDAKYTPITESNEASQFLGTRQFNIAEIARWFRIPPHLLMDLMRSTFSNIEHQGQEFVTYCLLPWLVRQEQQLNLKLLTREERARGYFFEHLLAGLLRGDFNSRIAGYGSAITIGVMTINQARRLENWPGIGPAGDQHYVPLNMTTAERVMKGEPPPGQPPPGQGRFPGRGAPPGGGGGGQPEAPPQQPPPSQIPEASALIEQSFNVGW